MADQTRTLEFTTAVERQPVKIDGIVYQMRLGNDMSYAERQQAAHLARQLHDPLIAMGAGRVLPKAQARAVDGLLRRVCGMAISAPPKVIKRLDQVDQIVLAMTFFERSVKGLGTLSAILAPRTPQAGKTPSSDSPGSTGAGPSRGQPTPRSASSSTH